MTIADIHAGALRATISTEGKFGWCGLSKLAHAQHAREWLLSPALTLEHYLGVPMNTAEYVEYEPCVSPKQISDVTTDCCTLRYAPVNCSQIACAVTYHLIAPHYIDVDLKLQTRRSDWPLGYVALFFATIVQAPIYAGINLVGEDDSVQVKSENRWLHFNSFATRAGNVAHPAGLPNPELPRPAESPRTYYHSDSSVRFYQPLFYGCVGEMALALMFHQTDKNRVRFVVNPLAPAFGGPAWDFIWIISQPFAGRDYVLSFRAMFKPFAGREDVLAEYENWERS